MRFVVVLEIRRCLAGPLLDRPRGTDLGTSGLPSVRWEAPALASGGAPIGIPRVGPVVASTRPAAPRGPMSIRSTSSRRPRRSPLPRVALFVLGAALTLSAAPAAAQTASEARVGVSAEVGVTETFTPAQTRLLVETTVDVGAVAVRRGDWRPLLAERERLFQIAGVRVVHPPALAGLLDRIPATPVTREPTPMRVILDGRPDPESPALPVLVVTRVYLEL